VPSVRAVVYDLLRELGMSTLFGNPGSTELLPDCELAVRFALPGRNRVGLLVKEAAGRHGCGAAASELRGFLARWRPLEVGWHVIRRLVCLASPAEL
jgi:hypothetical protein